MEKKFFEDAKMQQELERRLDIVCADDYQDPARKDLKAFDFVWIFGMVIVVSVVSFIWGFF